MKNCFRCLDEQEDVPFRIVIEATKNGELCEKHEREEQVAAIHTANYNKIFRNQISGHTGYCDALKRMIESQHTDLFKPMTSKECANYARSVWNLLYSSSTNRQSNQYQDYALRMGRRYLAYIIATGDIYCDIPSSWVGWNYIDSR